MGPPPSPLQESTGGMEPSIWYLTVPVFAYMAIVFSSYTNVTLLILDAEHDRLCSPDDDCDEDSVSASAARVSSYVFLVESLASLLIVGILGNFSDKHGRRFEIIILFIGILYCLHICIQAHDGSFLTWEYP